MNIIPGRYSAIAAEPAKGDTISIADIGRKLWRHKILIVTIIAAVTFVNNQVIDNLTPRYTANGQLLLRGGAAVDLNSVLNAAASGSIVDKPYIQSQIDVILSRELVGRVVDKLTLVNDPEFNQLLGQDPGLPLTTLNLLGLDVHTPGWIIDALRPDPIDPSAYPAELQRSLVVSNLRNRLQVINDGRSYTVSVRLESMVPKKAAQIVNDVMDFYLSSRLEAKYDATQRAATWLGGKVKDLRQRMLDADSAVAAFRTEHNIVDVGNTTLGSQQIVTLSGQLLEARRKRINAEAQLREIDAILKEGRDIISTPVIANSPIIQGLRSDENAMMAQIAQLRTTFGPKHRSVIDANAKLAEIRGRLSEEVATVRRGLASEVDVAKGQERQLERRMEELSAQNDDASRASVRLRQLISEADAARFLFNTFLEGEGKASVQVDGQQVEAWVLSRAETPIGYSYPNKFILEALSLIVGVMLALVTVVVIGLMSRGVHTQQDLERLTDLPVMGMVPETRRRPFGRRHPSVDALLKPRCGFTEALRSIRTIMLLSNVERPTRVVMMTSCVPDEGKTMLAITIGRVAAQAGNTVLLIDGDLRRPSLASDLGLPQKAAMEELLSGQSSLEEVMRADPVSGLMVVTAMDSKVPSPHALGSPRMKEILDQARTKFDLIIVDTPPITLVSDALMLCPLVDASILAVHWRSTPPGLIADTVRRFASVGFPLTGAILNRVNPRRYAGINAGYVKRYTKEYYAS